MVFNLDFWALNSDIIKHGLKCPKMLSTMYNVTMSKKQLDTSYLHYSIEKSRTSNISL